MDVELSIAALRQTGERLAERSLLRVTVYIVGGVAGMVTGQLPADRTTSDCDVMAVEPEDHWQLVAEAAETVAAELGLKPDWLGRQSEMFAWQMPLGWRRRCRQFSDFGRMRVMVCARGDLIAAKVMSAPRRPQDRDDLRAMRPTKEELRQVECHLDRVASESEPGGCDQQRLIVQWLRSLIDSG